MKDFVKLTPSEKVKFNKLNKSVNLLTKRLVTCKLSEFDKVEEALIEAWKKLETFLNKYGLDRTTRHLVR